MSIAWLDPDLFPDQMRALDEAWDVLVAREEWRQWVLDHRVPRSPSLVLTVRPGLSVRRLRKTKTGVSLHLPAAEVHEAHRSGHLVPLWMDVVHSMYSKWSVVNTCPPPPPLPGTPWAAIRDSSPARQERIEAEASGTLLGASEAEAIAVAWLANEQRDAAVTGLEYAGHSWRVFVNSAEANDSGAASVQREDAPPILVSRDTGAVSMDRAWCDCYSYE